MTSRLAVDGARIAMHMILVVHFALTEPAARGRSKDHLIPYSWCVARSAGDSVHIDVSARTMRLMRRIPRILDIVNSAENERRRV